MQILPENAPSDTTNYCDPENLKKKLLKTHLCQHCNKTFKLKIGLEKHIFTVHTKIRPHQCGKCDMNFSSKKDYKNHMHDHSVAERNGESTVQNVYFKGYLCFICRARFPRADELDIHRESCMPSYGLEPKASDILQKPVVESNSLLAQNSKRDLCSVSEMKKSTVDSSKTITEEQASSSPLETAMQNHSTGLHGQNEIALQDEGIKEPKVLVEGQPTKNGHVNSSKTITVSETIKTCKAKENVKEEFSKPGIVIPTCSVDKKDQDERLVFCKESHLVGDTSNNLLNSKSTDPDSTQCEISSKQIKETASISVKRDLDVKEVSLFIDDDAYFDELADNSQFIRVIAAENYVKKQEKFVCNFCENELLHRHAMERHMYGNHDNPRPFACTKCDMPFSTRAECARHLQDHKLAESKGLTSVENVYFKGYICMRCLYKFTLPGDLDVHKKNCRKEPKVCIFCGKGFKKCSSLKKHIADMHEGDQEMCDVCNKMVTNLSAHKRVHTDKRYICPTCAKVFNRADNLRVHQRIHSGERPFSCAICGEKFRLKCLLKSHMKHHKRNTAQDTTIVYKVHEEVLPTGNQSADSNDTDTSIQVTKLITADLVPTASAAPAVSKAAKSRAGKVKQAKSRAAKAKKAVSTAPAIQSISQVLPMKIEQFPSSVQPPILPQATCGSPPTPIGVRQNSNVQTVSHLTSKSVPIQGSVHQAYSQSLPQPVLQHSLTQPIRMQQPMMTQATTTTLPEINQILSPHRSHPHLVQSLSSQSPMMLTSMMSQTVMNPQPIVSQMMPAEHMKLQNLSQYDLPQSNESQLLTAPGEFAPMRNVEFTPVAPAYSQECSTNVAQQYGYNSSEGLPMSMDDNSQMQHYIGQPIAKQVVLDSDPVPIITSNSQVSGVAQSTTYLAL